MAELVFDGPAVIELIRRSLASTAHYVTMSERVERYAAEHGTTRAALHGDEFMAAARYVEGEEQANEAPGLWLVKDQGIYLMSNAYPDRGAPVYARGYGSKADWFKVREVAGGDDFVEFLGLEYFEVEYLDRPGSECIVTLTPTSISAGVAYVPRPGDPDYQGPPPAAEMTFGCQR